MDVKIYHHYLLIQKFQNISSIKNIRICGTIVAFELEIGESSYLNNIGKKIKSLAIDKGLFLRPLGNVIYLLPPLCITDKQLEKSYDIIFEILHNI